MFEIYLQMDVPYLCRAMLWLKLSIANSLVLMRDGEVIYHGSNEELLRKTDKNNTESAFIAIVSKGVS